MKPFPDSDSPTGHRPNKQGAPSGAAQDGALAADSARVAEYIGMTLLELSRQARAAELTTLAFLLEAAALQAAAGLRAGKSLETRPD